VNKKRRDVDIVKLKIKFSRLLSNKFLIEINKSYSSKKIALFTVDYETSIKLLCKYI